MLATPNGTNLFLCAQWTRPFLLYERMSLPSIHGMLCCTRTDRFSEPISPPPPPPPPIYHTTGYAQLFIDGINSLGDPLWLSSWADPSNNPADTRPIALVAVRVSLNRELCPEREEQVCHGHGLRWSISTTYQPSGTPAPDTVNCMCISAKRESQPMHRPTDPPTDTCTNARTKQKRHKQQASEHSHTHTHKFKPTGPDVPRADGCVRRHRGGRAAAAVEDSRPTGLCVSGHMHTQTHTWKSTQHTLKRSRTRTHTLALY